MATKGALDESVERLQASLNGLVGMYARMAVENVILRKAIQCVANACDEGMANGAYYLALASAGNITHTALAKLTPEPTP